METNELQQKLLSRKYDKEKKPEKSDVLLTIDNKTIGALQNIVCFQGIPKAGKSLIITSAISSAFTHTDIFGIKLSLLPDRNRICYVDTESSDYDFYLIIERMKQQMYLSNLPNNIDAFLFREDPAPMIIQMIETYLQNNPNCSVLVIDGILDLLNDFNSVLESANLIHWFKRITKQYNILIVSVLHLSKKDNHSIGHIGSFIDRKAQSVINIAHNSEFNTIEITGKYLRSTMPFDAIHIKHNGEAWQRIYNDHNTKEQYNKMEIIRIFTRILVNPLNYVNLVNNLSEYIGKSERTAKRMIKDALENNIIIKNDQLYKIK